MARRVGLLTLPLHTNYGGIIQIVALYQFLERHGKEPIFLRKKPVRSTMQKWLTGLLRRVPGQNLGGVRSNERDRALHYPFIRRFMPRSTRTVRTSQELASAVRQHDLDAVIVGSDQVWRPEYHNDHPAQAEPLAYFLDFADPAAVRRISYAASFGNDAWLHPEYSQQVAQLLSGFHAVSVREASGVDICHDTFGCDNVCVSLDPTLLVDPSFYGEAVAPGSAFIEPTVVKYVLDQSEQVQIATDRVMADLGNEPLEVFSISKDEMMDIPRWLQAFRDADFIITDSFHGTVFAIIFQKRFVTVPNRTRGMDRFTSLLERLGLSDRLLRTDDAEDITRIMASPIDYVAVSKRLDGLRSESARFLLWALN